MQCSSARVSAGRTLMCARIASSAACGVTSVEPPLIDARFMVHLYRNMEQLFVHPELFLEVFGLRLFGRSQRDDAGELAFAHAPHMQVTNLGRNGALLDD